MGNCCNSVNENQFKEELQSEQIAFRTKEQNQMNPCMEEEEYEQDEKIHQQEQPKESKYEHTEPKPVEQKEQADKIIEKESIQQKDDPKKEVSQQTKVIEGFENQSISQLVKLSQIPQNELVVYQLSFYEYLNVNIYKRMKLTQKIKKGENWAIFRFDMNGEFKSQGDMLPFNIKINLEINGKIYQRTYTLISDTDQNQHLEIVSLLGLEQDKEKRIQFEQALNRLEEGSSVKIQFAEYPELRYIQQNTFIDSKYGNEVKIYFESLNLIVKAVNITKIIPFLNKIKLDKSEVKVSVIIVLKNKVQLILQEMLNDLVKNINGSIHFLFSNEKKNNIKQSNNELIGNLDKKLMKDYLISKSDKCFNIISGDKQFASKCVECLIQLGHNRQEIRNL